MDYDEYERFMKIHNKGKLKNLNVMDYLVFIVVLSVLVFTTITLYFHYKHGIEVSDIATPFFSIFSLELLAMASISVSNNVGKNKGDDENV